MDGDIVTTLLTAFQEVFTRGAARLIPYALGLLTALVTIEVAVTGVVIAQRGDDNIAETLGWLAFKVGLYMALITQWTPLTRGLVRGFVWLALYAAGDTISETDFTDPSRLVWFGISVATLVYNRIFAYTGLDALYNISDIVWTGLAATACIIAFAWFGYQVFTALLDFYCVSSVTVILLPFGVIRQTTFLAEKTLAYVWACAVKLLIQAFIAGAALPIMQSPRLNPGLNPTFAKTATLALAGFAIALLAPRCSRIALGFLQGSPQLEAQTITHGLQTSVRTLQQLTHVLRTIAPQPNTPSPHGATSGRPVI